LGLRGTQTSRPVSTSCQMLLCIVSTSCRSAAVIVSMKNDEQRASQHEDMVPATLRLGNRNGYNGYKGGTARTVRAKASGDDGL